MLNKLKESVSLVFDNTKFEDQFKGKPLMHEDLQNIRENLWFYKLIIIYVEFIWPLT